MALDKNSQIKKRKIAMIGTASSWKDAPYNDKDWEIWALNGLSAVIPRFDRYFNVHNYNLIEEQYDKNHLEFLRKCEDRLYLNNSYSELPKAVVYPLEKITKKYGKYFTNTVSYMIALALYEGVDEIGLWGIDMAHSSEYADQRPSCEYFIGRAVGEGVKVTISENSEICKCSHMYGFEEEPPLLKAIMEKRKEIVKYKQASEIAKQKAAIEERCYIYGLEILDYLAQIWGNQ